MDFGRAVALPLIIASLAVGLIAFAYRSARDRLSRRSMATLAAFRIVAVALLIFCLLEPTRVLTREEPVRAQIALLADRSASMAIEDEGGRRRWDVAVETGRRLQRRLESRFDVRTYVFDSELHRSRWDDEAPEGRATDALDAVESAVRLARGAPFAGTILLTDGAQNVGAQSAREVFGAPVFAVGIGDPTPPRDIAVNELNAPPTVFVNETTRLSADITIQGYVGREVSLTLLRDGQPLAERGVVADSDDFNATVSFEDTPKEEGDAHYTVRASPALDELTAENNERSASVEALPSRIRVLYIEGSPRHEFASLRRLLRRVPAVELTSVLTATPTRGRAPGSAPAATGLYPLDGVSKGFPVSEAALDEYDVIVIGDMPLTLFTDAQRTWLTRFIEERGKGIAWLAGEQWLGRPLGVGPFERLLPVTVPPSGARILTGEFSVSVTDEGRRHAATQLAESTADNDLLWRQMPLWSRLYSGLTIKRGAVALARANQMGDPVVVYHRAGSGKSLLVATDATWYWGFAAKQRRSDEAFAEAHDRFWAQSVRWLATPANRKQVDVSVARAEAQMGETAEINVRVYGAGFEPAVGAVVELTVADAEGRTTSVPAIASGSTNGLYEGRIQATRSGAHRVRASATYRGVELGEDEATFNVTTPRLEFERSQRNDAFLKALAASSGGAFTTADNADSIIPLLQESGETRTVRERRALWDHPIILLATVGLLGVEWVLRKRRGLI